MKSAALAEAMSNASYLLTIEPRNSFTVKPMTPMSVVTLVPAVELEMLVHPVQLVSAVELLLPAAERLLSEKIATALARRPILAPVHQPVQSVLQSTVQVPSCLSGLSTLEPVVVVFRSSVEELTNSADDHPSLELSASVQSLASVDPQLLMPPELAEQRLLSELVVKRLVQQLPAVVDDDGRSRRHAADAG